MRTVIAILVLSAPLVSQAQSAYLDRGQVVGMAEVPPKAQTALIAATHGRGLTELRRVREDGRTVYRARVPGSERVVEVTPEGTVLPPAR